MDGITLYCIRKELAQYLPLKVQRIHQPRPLELVLSLWSPGVRARLIVSADPPKAFLGFIREIPGNPKSPPGFCLGLRKRLEGGRLMAIDQETSDRVLYFRFVGRDELGDSTPYVLVADMAGKGANLGIYKDGRLVATAVPPDENRFMTDGRYNPPETSKLGLLCDELPGGFRRKIAVSLCDEHVSPQKTIGSLVQGLGPHLSGSVLELSGQDPRGVLTQEGANRVVEVLLDLRQCVLEGEYHPHLYRGAKGDIVVHALPLAQLKPIKAYDTLLEAAAAFRTTVTIREKVDSLKVRGAALYRRTLKKLESRIAAQSGDLSAAQDTEKYKLMAELIDASGNKQPAGYRWVTVLDYYKDPPEKTQIPLDPRYSSGDNARRYYALYKKMTRAKRILSLSIERLRRNLQDLEATYKVFLKGDDPDDLDLGEMEKALEVLQRIASQAGVRVKRDRKALSTVSSKTQRPAFRELLPPGVRSLEGPGQSKIYVALSAQANDHLVTKLKRRGDLWFHAKGAKGAHVLLRPGQAGKVTEEALEAAAKVAAERSGASGSDKIQVDWVDAARVKKPRGAAPGFVIFTGQKTLTVSAHQAAPIKEDKSDTP